jgi:hypothetical protein
MPETAKESPENDQLSHLVALTKDMRKKKDAIVERCSAKMRRQVDLLNTTLMKKPKGWKLSAEGQAFSNKVHAQFDEAAKRRQEAAAGSHWLSRQIQKFEDDAKRKDGEAAAPGTPGGDEGMEDDWGEVLREAMEDDAFFDRKGGPSDYSLEAGKKRKRSSERDRIDSDSQDEGRNKGLLKIRGTKFISNR